MKARALASTFAAQTKTHQYFATHTEAPQNSDRRLHIPSAGRGNCPEGSVAVLGLRAASADQEEAYLVGAIAEDAEAPGLEEDRDSRAKAFAGAVARTCGAEEAEA